MKGMNSVSIRELQELSDYLGVTLRDDELEEVNETVNRFLDGVSQIDDLVQSNTDGYGDRRWSSPDSTDSWNAIVTDCRVPPRTDSTGLLEGLTIGLKDIIAVAGIPMQCGSRVMEGFIPGEDAIVVDRLRRAGGQITAKTNLDEFAGSGSGITGVHGTVINPYDADRTAGGSSGGSAVAVAAGLVDVALGTDTGGSVRIPASFCGVIGLKPTYGLVPLTGVMENTVTQDHVGPITETIEEAARVLEAIAGWDERDPSSLQAAGRPSYTVGGYVDGLTELPEPEDVTMGVLEEGFGDGINEAVIQVTHDAIERVRDAGVSVDSISIPMVEDDGAIKDILSFVELAAHWWAGGAPYRRGGGVNIGYQAGFASRSSAASRNVSAFYKSKLLAGAELMQYEDGIPYTKAQLAREELASKVNAALEDVDVIVSPTMPSIAPLIEEAADPGFDYARNTRLANVTRLPAISVPNGRVDDLPIGFQLLGKAFGEAELLRVASVIHPHL